VSHKLLFVILVSLVPKNARFPIKLTIHYSQVPTLLKMVLRTKKEAWIMITNKSAFLEQCPMARTSGEKMVFEKGTGAKGKNKRTLTCIWIIYSRTVRNMYTIHLLRSSMDLKRLLFFGCLCAFCHSATVGVNLLS